MPVEGTHGEMVVGTFSDSKLLFEIFKGIESVRRIELLVIFAVRALNLAVVPRCTDADQLVANSELSQCLFKKRFSVCAV